MKTIGLHPENLHVGNRYQFLIDCGDTTTMEEGYLREIVYGSPIMLEVHIDDDSTSEFEWATVLEVKKLRGSVP